MLIERIMTGVLLGVVFLVAVFFAPQYVFSGMVYVILIIGAWEWGNLCRLRYSGRIAFTAFVAFSLLLIIVSLSEIVLHILLFSAVFFWMVAAFMVVKYPEGLRWHGRAPKIVMGWFVLVPAWLSVHHLMQLEMGKVWVLVLFLVVTGADIGAYTAGKLWGKHKMMPRVSPGKTFEGLLGGQFVCLILALSLAYFLALPKQELLYLVMLILFTSLMSVLGDLFESMFKRDRGIKDSGVLLPGHGGVLDRIDGFTAAAPVFVLGILYLPIV